VRLVGYFHKDFERFAFYFRTIHPRCVLDNRNHSGLSYTIHIYSYLTQQHVTALRDNLLMSDTVDTL
jgi:hypothetical protein